MRSADSYRGARKREAKTSGRKWDDTPFQKVSIRRPTAGAKGKSLPLKSVDGDVELVPGPTPGRFLPKLGLPTE